MDLPFLHSSSFKSCMQHFLVLLRNLLMVDFNNRYNYLFFWQHQISQQYSSTFHTRMQMNVGPRSYGCCNKSCSLETETISLVNIRITSYKFVILLLKNTKKIFFKGPSLISTSAGVLHVSLNVLKVRKNQSLPVKIAFYN